MSQKTIHLHIGTHKTGSTTVQSFLARNRDPLAKNGMAFYRGAIIDSNHIEIYLSALDENRDSLALQSLEIGPLSELKSRTDDDISRFLEETSATEVIISSEGLSLLRSQSEMANLFKLLRGNDTIVRVICVLRDKQAFLSAYRKQIVKVLGRHPSKDPTSSLYNEEDSWLADFDTLLKVYSETFGAENMRVIDYDHEVMKNGDVLPLVLRSLNVNPALIPQPGSQEGSNQSTVMNQTKQAIYKVMAKFFSKMINSSHVTLLCFYIQKFH